MMRPCVDVNEHVDDGNHSPSMRRSVWLMCPCPRVDVHVRVAIANNRPSMRRSVWLMRPIPRIDAKEPRVVDVPSGRCEMQGVDEAPSGRCEQAACG